MSNKKLVLIELNEINFDYVREYVKTSELPNFKRILSEHIFETSSEENYEELEPWIQWVSAHSEKTLKEHGVFRLGDIVNKNIEQIFEKVEKKGYTVGCVSPMNASNKLSNPSYFIPDPWTLTPSDETKWSRGLTRVIRQVVNDNAQSKVTISSLLTLCAGIMKFARFRNYSQYLVNALKSFSNPWRKAMFLDLLLNDIHFSLLRAKKAQFSTLFLNAGAHIQHHYMFNSKVYKRDGKLRNPEWYVDQKYDPLLDLLKLYDRILGEYLNSDYDLIVATGLSQIPYTHEKYYWRIKDHATFLKKAGIKFKAVFPRMTRDFLVEFDSESDAKLAEAQLEAYHAKRNDTQLFKEIDNRGDSLFVTLTYPEEIKGEFIISNGERSFDIHSDLAFVAIKNGMHCPKGYVYCRGNINTQAFEQSSHVKTVGTLIDGYFSRMTAPDRS